MLVKQSSTDGDASWETPAVTQAELDAEAAAREAGDDDLPLVVFGLTDEVWVMVVAAFLVGAAFNGGVVIWGTLLQRRVPAEMLGRVSSLDFFVSLAFMPVSMAVAGPAGESLGLPVVFQIAGVAPLVIAGVAIVAARMTRDELANPIDVDEAEAVVAASAATPAVELATA